jgi:hypothetical protein
MVSLFVKYVNEVCFYLISCLEIFLMILMATNGSWLLYAVLKNVFLQIVSVTGRCSFIH